ncbi:MAG: SDR family oxidoreductase [Verrucomicrobiaceae bacterium]|nr:MAG: SDR family oxidoreductase [Verrucomicrobiaceae bacterium]
MTTPNETEADGPAEKIALVTGSSSGIGAAIAERLAADGYLALINARSENAGALKTRDAILAAGHRAELSIGSISKVTDIRHLFADIRERYGRIDVLVNNAGICPFHEWDEVTEEIWDITHETNLRAGFFCTQEAAKLMIEKKIAGRIMAISSISAIKGGTVQTHYCPTKGGQISMMNAFAVCLGPHGITCNSILPGTIETPINAEYLATGTNRANLEIQTCVGYIGQPRDVAGIVSFLATPEARYITGASILVDGGELVKHL